MENFTLPSEIIPALYIVISCILIDFIIGILLHIKDGTFQLNQLPKFLSTGVLPYVGGLLILGMAAQYIGKFYCTLFYAIASIVVLKYFSDLKDKLCKIFNISSLK